MDLIQFQLVGLFRWLFQFQFHNFELQKTLQKHQINKSIPLSAMIAKFGFPTCESALL